MIKHPLFGLILTIAVYALCQKLQKRYPSPFLNPLLLASMVIIAVLIVFDIPYQDYNVGGSVITMLIGPATVSLAIPLYKHFDIFKKHARLILISIVSGTLAHGLSIGFFAFIFKFNAVMLATFIPKSVTTAIAVDIAKMLGGHATLTLCIVVITGILGAALSPILNKVFGFNDPISQGIALGVSAHAVGTSKAVEMGETQGTMASLSLIICGILTVVLSPLLFTIYRTLLHIG